MTKIIKRTKLGCLSCRFAKKKCDELKPICTLCLKRNIKCIWPIFQNQSLSNFIDKQGKFSFNDSMKRKIIRSKNGCFQCRKSKKKCDELKPICTLCINKNIICCYPDYKLIEDIPTFHSNHSINFANDQMFLINVFFNNIIETLIPKDSLNIISEFTFESMKQCIFIKDSITSLSTAFIFNIDTTNSIISKYSNLNNYNDIENKLQFLLLTILISLFTETNKEIVLLNIQNALNISKSLNPLIPSKKFKFLIESLIYNYSVTLILTTINSKLQIQNPFTFMDNWRILFPKFPDIISNPLLGNSLDSFIIIAKVSYLFKFPNNNNNNYYYPKLLNQIDNILLIQPMNIISNGLSIPLNLTTYKCLLVSKLLLLYLTNGNNSIEFNNIISNFLIILKYNFENSQMFSNNIEICDLWSMFMFGINLKNEKDQLFLINWFKKSWEKSHNIGYFKAIKKFEIAWQKNLGFDILKDPQFLSDLHLS
ncbi:hypothetical protein C6P40_002625 [Pichia californica]|uniref:Zn(2)-C6 fungal-type domain-containing protein n=1 Tax=Pichia californica TaxID=460514 RepID=A0A9P7BCR4_9ASCO|nr:hypothetical protein C6P42_002572 [[Candida] californica]KAG0687242.1 hypothetical protein C6P40_002625 [[Candida] californica]